VKPFSTDLLLSNGEPDYELIEERLHFVCQWRMAEGWTVEPAPAHLPVPERKCCPLGAAYALDPYSAYPGGCDVIELLGNLGDLEFAQLARDLTEDPMMLTHPLLDFFVSFISAFDAGGYQNMADPQGYAMGQRFRAAYVQEAA